MIYALIISLLIEKPFYLLRPQSFSFQIVSEFIDIFVKFSNFRWWGGAFDSLFCPEGRVLYTMIVSGGKGFCSLQVVSWGFVWGMVLDEIDTCIIFSKRLISRSSFLSLSRAFYVAQLINTKTVIHTTKRKK